MVVVFVLILLIVGGLALAVGGRAGDVIVSGAKSVK